MTATKPLVKSKTSYIEDHEVAEAEKVIAEEFAALTGKPGLPRPVGPWLAIKIYIRPEELKTITNDQGEKVTLYLPDASRASDKWTNCVGLVVGMGPAAYTGKNSDGSDRFPEGAWCRVGDFVVFPRYEGQVFMWRGVAMMLIYDDKVQMVVSDPTEVQAGHTVDKL